jgi:rod shape determining protein RodA
MNKNIIILILLNFALISLTAIFSLNKIDLFYKQSLFWILGFILFYSSLFINYHLIFERYISYFIISLSLIILILVLFVPSNLKSWFNLFFFNFQPSEFSKIGFFIVLAFWLSYYNKDLKNPLYIVFSFLTISPFLFLIFLQPDFGMVFLYFTIWLFVILPFLTKKEILIGILIIAILFLILWFFVLKEYQKERFLILFNPEKDPLKSGYNLRQIKITLSTSSFFGKGVGLGDIGREGFLPAAHTDFILTFLIEERGILIFIIYSLLMYILLFQILTSYKYYNKNPLIKNFIYIIFQYFLVKYIITSLVNFGLFPIIGLPVPFLSYGGSHLVFDLWLLGILINLGEKRI